MDFAELKNTLIEKKKSIEKDLNDQISFIDKLENSNNFKIVKFGASWCSPCVQIKPYFIKSKEENPNIDFHDLDMGTQDSQQNVVLAQKFQVKGIPFVVLLSPKNEVLKKANDTFHFMDEFKNLLNPVVQETE